MAMGIASGSSRRRGGRRRAAIAEINVTPLVDVMLVLLIIFMVTAPLLTSGVPIDLPDSRANPLDQDPRQITLSLDENGFVFIDDTLVEVGQLPQAVAQLDCGAAEAPLITLRADRGLDYGRVMAVMGELNRAGCNSISLVTNGSSQAP
ncbi:ExbD/TolR family protein [Tsuneonella sp. HG222]